MTVRACAGAGGTLCAMGAQEHPAWPRAPGSWAPQAVRMADTQHATWPGGPAALGSVVGDHP